MKQLFLEMKQHLERNEDLVFVTVIASSGAVPRGAGARMLVGKEGRICGTVGGGAVEFRSEQMAMEAIKHHTSCIKQFILKRNQVEDIGMICGGDVTLYFRFIEGSDTKMLQLCELALAQFNELKRVWLVTELTPESSGQMGLFSEKLGLVGIDEPAITPFIKGQTCKFEYENRNFYAEEILTPGYVYIFGGGHVSKELVPVLSHLGFRCKVFEDREDFITAENFPEALERKVVDFEHIEEMAEITSDDYIIIMTRGHKSDKVIQVQALRTPARYIGVIGSKHKKASVQKDIMTLGFSKEDVERITTPIGLLSIGAETPAEIAISIAGQLIAVRADKGIIS